MNQYQLIVWNRHFTEYHQLKNVANGNDSALSSLCLGYLIGKHGKQWVDNIDNQKTEFEKNQLTFN